MYLTLFLTYFNPCSSIHSFIHSFIDSFIDSFIRSFIRSFIHSFVRSFIHSFIHSFLPSFVYALHQLGADVFNALALNENASVFEGLQFGAGNGYLHYYVFNWKCPQIKPTEVGLVLV